MNNKIVIVGDPFDTETNARRRGLNAKSIVARAMGLLTCQLHPAEEPFPVGGVCPRCAQDEWRLAGMAASVLRSRQKKAG